MENRDLRIAIVGAGPAGMFCAYGLAQQGYTNVTLFEKGLPIMARVCPHLDCRTCPFKRSCSILCGEGGAGGWSDGKITLSTGRGVQLDPSALNFQKYDKELLELKDICLDLYPEAHFFKPIVAPTSISDSGFVFESYPLLFYGTDGIRVLFKRLGSYLRDHGISMRFNSALTAIQPLPGISKMGSRKVYTLRIARGNVSYDAGPYDRVILATGSYDFDWNQSMAVAVGAELNLEGPAGFGIRLETKAEILEPLISKFYDFKLHLNWMVDGVPVTFRSFCVNREGSVTNQHHPDVIGINGRSEPDRTGLSNLAIVVKLPGAKKLIRDLGRAVNAAGKGLPVYQPLSDFLEGSAADSLRMGYVSRFVRNCEYANLRDVFPVDLWEGFSKYIVELSQILGDAVLYDYRTVVYAPELKYPMPQWTVDEGFRVEGVPGLQVIGNAAGYTDSISTAAVMGLVASRNLEYSHDGV